MLMASFASLKGLLTVSLGELGADKVASVVVANFDIKQRFKDLPSTDEVITLTEDEALEDPDPDAEHKKDQLAASKKILLKIHQDALDDDADFDFDADEYGLGNANTLLDADAMKAHIKRQKTMDNFTNGGGAFTRSG